MKETPSQTAGPFIHIGLAPEVAGVDGMTGLGGGIDAPGTRIRILGNIRDGAGDLVKDAMVESWQADADAGHHPGLWARASTDFKTGEWAIETVKPGSTDNHAPHITLYILARGINIGLHTRLYFADEDNAADPVLAQVPEARRDTLIARDEGDATYRFDIVLQGDDETVFFDA
jgi:protocatechuate 3,4-dioxygenase alpha subunit